MVKEPNALEHGDAFCEAVLAAGGRDPDSAYEYDGSIQVYWGSTGVVFHTSGKSTFSPETPADIARLYPTPRPKARVCWFWPFQGAP